MHTLTKLEMWTLRFVYSGLAFFVAREAVIRPTVLHIAYTIVFLVIAGFMWVWSAKYVRNETKGQK